MHKLTVPYFKQERDFSCGPAALRMILAYHGIFKTEGELTEALRTSFEGTCNDMLADVTAQILKCEAHTYDSLDEVYACLRDEKPIIVNYLNPEGDIGHFAVVIGYTQTHLILNDPKNGADYHLTHIAFFERWVSGDGTHVRWGLTITETPQCDASRGQLCP